MPSNPTPNPNKASAGTPRPTTTPGQLPLAHPPRSPFPHSPIPAPPAFGHSLLSSFSFSSDSIPGTPPALDARRSSATPSRIMPVNHRGSVATLPGISCSPGGGGPTPFNSPIANFTGKQALAMGVNPAVAGLASQLCLTPSFNGFKSFAVEMEMEAGGEVAGEEEKGGQGEGL